MIIHNLIYSAYTQPHRHYHNFDHITYMLNVLSELGCLNSPVLYTGVLYHDIVYYPERSDNEEASCEMYELHADLVDYDHPEAETIIQMIMDTKKHLPQITESFYLVDADLAILGSNPHEYRQYLENLAKEYSHLTREEQLKARNLFLQERLNRDTIFTSPIFRDKFEYAAHNNLTAELAKNEIELGELEIKR